MRSSKLKGALLAVAGSAVLATAVPAVSQEPFLGEIRLVGFNFAPRGFANADGQELFISSNSALFALFGTMYGGDGRSVFNLPDLRGRAAIHAGQGPGLADYRQGQKGGRETVTLTVLNLPSHSHNVQIRATDAEGDTDDPTGNVWASVDRSDYYSTQAPNVTMSTDAVTQQNVGNGQAFNIRGPYLTMRYVVALTGIFPSRN